MADQFDDYTKLLALAQANKSKTKAELRAAISASGIKLLDEEPMSGYFRCAAVKDGPLLPVAIWRDENGKLQVLRNGQPVSKERVWSHCVWNPIPYEWYEGATERGEKWPDEAALAPDPAPPNDAEREQIGSNNPPVEDEAAALKSQIEAARGVAEQDYKEITTDEQAAAAQSLRSRLNELSGSADKKREEEKRPHFEKAKAVDAKWQPVVKLGKEAADWLRAKLSDYATRKANAEAEARRVALAEEARLADERRAAGGSEDPGSEQVVEQTAAAPEPASATVTTIKGATGRAARVTIKKVAKVVDYDAAYTHLKKIPEIKAAIDKVAQRMIDAGNECPGVEIHERRDVA